jgi:hypothetical protein
MEGAMSEIWTGDARRLLYRRLVEKFGSLDNWEGTSSPGGGHDAKFDEFCEDFARVVGAKSGEAVKHQIRFAMPETRRGSTWEEGQARTAIMNKAAALEAGFIQNKHLPDLHAVGRNPTLADL